MFEPIPCPTNRHRELNKFYKKYKQNVSCHQLDQVYIVTTEGDEIIAGVIIRVLPNTQMKLLRSLFVAPEYRNKGIAKKLCTLATFNQKEEVFALLEPHLLDFYIDLGFHVIKEFNLFEPQIEKQIKKGLLLMSKPSINQ